MSYALGLYMDGKPVIVDRHEDGATYAIGGITEAELNITYNYSPFYYAQLDPKEGLRWLYGKRGEECIKRLTRAVETLGVERDTDYWKATAGNAGYALSILLRWARSNPDAVFEGD